MSDDRLERWEASGGGWRVVRRTGEEIILALLTCDGGTEMDRITSSDPDLLALVGDRLSSED